MNWGTCTTMSQRRLIVVLAMVLVAQSAYGSPFDSITTAISGFVTRVINGDFPDSIAPFDKRSELLSACQSDPLCGSFRYEVYPDPDRLGEDVFETGVVNIFYFEGAYHLHYQRDDGAQYIGLGIRRNQQLAVTYYYPNATDVGLETYKISESGLLEGSWVSIGNPVGQQGQRTIRRMQ